MQLYRTFKKSPLGSKAGNADVSSCRTQGHLLSWKTVLSSEEETGSVLVHSGQKGVDLPAKSTCSDAWTPLRNEWEEG